MKKYIHILVVALIVFTASTSIYAQNNRQIDNYRQPDQRGINVFEDPKDTISSFENLRVKIGGAFALQFQGLDHSNSGVVPLAGITPNFNLPTANLDLDVALAPGVRMHLRTYLSSRHHHEPYVKGGFFQVDGLDFIKEGFLDDVMKYTTIRIGQMENNYGDAHFRRTDNAQAIYNPFVGNLIMDSFTTEIGAEVYYQRSGFIAMVGFTNGKLNQSVVENDNGKSGGASFLAKLGYDKQLNDDLRVRLTGSLYNTGFVPNLYLYNADRAGSRYYNVLEAESATSDNFRSGRFAPSFKNSITAFMFNPFVKYRGLEFFGTLEFNSGSTNSTETSVALDGKTQQYAGELIYRFGQNENFYVGGRYNVVNAEYDGTDDTSISRFQASAGWFMTKNILAKLEYVTQSYDDFTGLYEDAQFDGVMFEAVISF
ncbi:conserved hypothetical protein [Formosa agariphila KMM 3901]|uniref:Phosphate-selective porin O and P n=1 Tax=Formosa agariphila (strain DSM 15362 / KCTC 12365 / LMG 23005 / KMM 3901 / M-2Alg 35-1) TaxID=1347342 RepID=T2KLJ2_FORAG|nr:hypothetical protein [Formosa agariphila]CDF78854.1 conserved hypothetical protein [Formosa agariphila KMM 3901]